MIRAAFSFLLGRTKLAAICANFTNRGATLVKNSKSGEVFQENFFPGVGEIKDHKSWAPWSLQKDAMAVSKSITHMLGSGANLFLDIAIAKACLF